jgi:hypothetical protein
VRRMQVLTIRSVSSIANSLHSAMLRGHHNRRRFSYSVKESDLARPGGNRSRRTFIADRSGLIGHARQLVL